MKKTIAVALCGVFALCCFTACGSKTKGGEVVTDSANNPIALVTEEGGGAKRDEEGNLVVLVTEEDGKNVKDKDGNYVTEALTMNHVLKFGDTAETKHYSLKIPSGWTYNEKSLVELMLDNPKGDKINIVTAEGQTASQLATDPNLLQIINLIDQYNSNAVPTNSSVKINGVDCPFIARYVPGDENKPDSYLGYIFFENDGVGYTCRITGSRDVTENIADIEAVLNTIQYR